jgi:hypothetical protein
MTAERLVILSGAKNLVPPIFIAENLPEMRLQKMKQIRVPFVVISCVAVLLHAPLILWAEYEGSQILSALQKHLKERVVNPEKGREPKFKAALSTNEREASQGHFSHVALESSPVEIRKKLTLETLRIEGADVVIDPEKLIKDGDLIVKSSKHMTLSASATAQQFTSFLAKGKHTKDMKLKVTFENDKMRVTGNWKLGFLGGPINTIGRLVVAGKDEIHFKVDSLRLNGIGAPRAIINKFENSINPVVESQDLPLNPPINKVQFKGDMMTISGERGK